MGGEKTKPRYKQYFSIDESVGLHENYSFRLAIFFPIAACILLVGLFSWQLHQKGLYNFYFTQPGITAFVKYFSFPISLLSLSIVFGVMVARFHSSKQKAKSNEITDRNNSVNYFYKTHEEFEKYCAKLVGSKDNRFYSIRADACYESLFSLSTPKSPSLFVSESFFNSINSFYSIYADNLIEYLRSEDYNEAKSNARIRMGPRHNFSKGLTNKLDKIGVSIDWVGSSVELSIVEKELCGFYSFIFDLFSFPGLENRLDSRERLNNIHSKWIEFIKNHPECIKVNNSPPQS
ncbi:MAG: hypothetical protein ACTH4U_08745 [Pseudoalteromonas prydzensis]|uniref:hypothetical protein n=1 Tax=Pseudoalteromonas prydzensis TaxID=182141 RepID=UPI003F94B41D